MADNATPKKQTAPKKIRYSIFFITWNSNYYVADEADPKYQEIMTQAADYLNKKLMPSIKEYIIVKKDGHNIDEWARDIKTQGRFEIGPDSRRLHCHCLVRVDHWTNVRLDIDRIRRELTENITSAPGAYLYVSASNDTKATIEDYINKTAR